MIFDPNILQKYRLAFLKLRAISGSSRFFILNIIRINEPVNVTKIVEISGLDQPIVSQLLSVLKKAEFIQSVSNKKEKFYSINSAQINNIIGFCAEFCSQKEKVDSELSDSYTQIFKTYNDLKYLLNPGRTILVEFLDKKGELSVNEMVEITNMSQSIISQNLAVLKNLGVVQNRIEGRKSIYSLNKITLDRYEKLIVQYF
jgi:ArsR family transcriptional regulator, virulence genes transcriptional regulator